MTATLAADTMLGTALSRRPAYAAPQSSRPECPGGPAHRDRPVNPMPVAECAAGPADDEALHERAERGLRHYTAQTANAVGASTHAAWCEWSDAPSAYVPLDHRLPDHPQRDAALIWAPERGWVIAVETGCGEDLLLTASLGGDVLPAPSTVAAWVRAVVADQHTGKRACPRATVGDANLARRLANWAGHEPTVEDGTN